MEASQTSDLPPPSVVAVSPSGSNSSSTPSSSTPSSSTPSSSTPSSSTLGNAINAYRVERGLPPIAQSAALIAVAEAHVRDLQNNGPSHGRCNLHSWSGAGPWSACCYTSDHAAARCMWDKPRELTSYSGNGYEVSAGGTAPMSIESAIRLWDRSHAHRDVIVNGGTWTQPWGAMGAAVYGNYAVAWFGHEAE